MSILLTPKGGGAHYLTHNISLSHDLHTGYVVRAKTMEGLMLGNELLLLCNMTSILLISKGIG